MSYCVNLELEEYDSYSYTFRYVENCIHTSLQCIYIYVCIRVLFDYEVRVCVCVLLDLSNSCIQIQVMAMVSCRQVGAERLHAFVGSRQASTFTPRREGGSTPQVALRVLRRCVTPPF